MMIMGLQTMRFPSARLDPADLPGVTCEADRAAPP